MYLHSVVLRSTRVVSPDYARFPGAPRGLPIASGLRCEGRLGVASVVVIEVLLPPARRSVAGLLRSVLLWSWVSVLMEAEVGQHRKYWKACD